MPFVVTVRLVSARGNGRGLGIGRTAVAGWVALGEAWACSTEATVASEDVSGSGGAIRTGSNAPRGCLVVAV
jgi:hypothetical protein